MKQLLPKLTPRLPPCHTSLVPPFVLAVPKDAGAVISHAWFWPRVGSFFKERDVVVAETGEPISISV